MQPSLLVVAADDDAIALFDEVATFLDSAPAAV